MNGWLAPNGMEVFIGEIAMETRTAVPTVRVVVPFTGPRVAVMVVVPSPALVARPLLPEALLIIATAADDELQVTTSVMIWVELSV